MTDDAIGRALIAAVRNAFEMGRQGGEYERALRYAQMLVRPIVEARIEQAVEDGFAAARRTVPGGEA